MKGESEIIALIRQRDQTGLRYMYDQYGATILGVIKRIIKDNPVAEEILQHTFLKAWNKIDTYNSNKSSLYTWLSSIARNTAIDKVRLKGFQNQNKSESFETNVHDTKSSITDLSNIDVKNLLVKLEDKYSLVLDMMYLKGYTQSEISDELSIPLGTVKTRLRKSIKILREELKHEKGLFIGALLIIILMLLLCL